MTKHTQAPSRHRRRPCVSCVSCDLQGTCSRLRDAITASTFYHRAQRQCANSRTIHIGHIEGWTPRQSRRSKREIRDSWRRVPVAVALGQRHSPDAQSAQPKVNVRGRSGRATRADGRVIGHDHVVAKVPATVQP